MAGFMAGFGSAFAKSYQSAVDADRDLQNDIFKLKYSDYLTRRDQYEKIDRENKKMYESAKTLARLTGQPIEAASDFYNMLQAGAKYDDLYQMGMQNKAIVSDAPQKDNTSDGGADNLTQGAKSAVDSQMTASGMQTPQDGGVFNPNPNEQPAQSDPRDQAAGQGMTGALGGMIQTGRQKRTNRMNDLANERLQQVTGQSQDQIDKIMGSQMEGTPVFGQQDRQVTWKPIGVGGAKPDLSKINTPGDAAYAKSWVDLYGSTEEKKFVQNVYDNLMNVEAQKKKLEGEAMGTFISPVRAAIKNDKTGKWDGGLAVKEPDGQGGFVWKDGEGRIIPENKLYPYTKAMEEEIEAQTKELGKPIQDYNQKLVNFQSLVRTSSDIENLAKRFPEAMSISGDISQVTDAWRRAGVNIMHLINPPVSPDGTVNIDPKSALAELNDAEQKVSGMLANVDPNTVIGQNAQNALAAAMIDIKSITIAYMCVVEVGPNDAMISD